MITESDCDQHKQQKHGAYDTKWDARIFVEIKNGSNCEEYHTTGYINDKSCVRRTFEWRKFDQTRKNQEQQGGAPRYAGEWTEVRVVDIETGAARVLRRYV